jgi:hypothetical protein
MAKNGIKVKKILQSGKSLWRSPITKSNGIIGSGIYSSKKMKFNGGKSRKRR